MTLLYEYKNNKILLDLKHAIQVFLPGIQSDVKIHSM